MIGVMVRFFRRKKNDEAASEQSAPAEEAAAVTEGVAEEVQEPVAAEVVAPENAASERDDEEAAPVEQAVERTRKTWFGRIGGIFKRGLDDSLWEELEETLIAADTGVPTTIRIIEEVQARVKEESIRDPDKALDVLKEELIEVLDVDTGRGKIWSSNGDPDSSGGMAVILVVGVNGTGKTTSIGKMAHAYKARGKKVVLAAADTFRAAAIEQLKKWGEQAGGPAAHKGEPDGGAAQGRSRDPAPGPGGAARSTSGARRDQRPERDAAGEVLHGRRRCDGRPPGEAGRHGQGRRRLLRGTAKGGVVFSVCDQLRVPVRFVGTGERPQDLARFEARPFVEALFSG